MGAPGGRARFEDRVRDRRGQLHFVVKPTWLGVARDVAVITLCVVILAIIAVDLLRGRSPGTAAEGVARTLR